MVSGCDVSLLFVWGFGLVDVYFSVYMFVYFLLLVVIYLSCCGLCCVGVADCLFAS